MNVLIVDDDLIWARGLARGLLALGHASRTCASVAEALAALSEERFTLMVTDVDVGGAYDGIDLACWALNGLHLPVVIVTSGDAAWASAGAVAMGAPNALVVPKSRPASALVARILLDDPGAPDGAAAPARATRTRTSA